VAILLTLVATGPKWRHIGRLNSGGVGDPTTFPQGRTLVYPRLEALDLDGA